MSTSKQIGPLKYQGGGIITGPDRFSETVGEKPGHTLLVATMPSLHQSWAFRDNADRDAIGRAMSAAPELLAALNLAEATLERLAPTGSRATQGTRDVIAAAIAKAEGREAGKD